MSAEHDHCYADFHATDNAPLTVGRFQIRPTRIADYAMLGSVTEEGDELEVTEAFLEREGYDGQLD